MKTVVKIALLSTLMGIILPVWATDLQIQIDSMTGTTHAGLEFYTLEDGVETFEAEISIKEGDDKPYPRQTEKDYVLRIEYGIEKHNWQCTFKGSSELAIIPTEDTDIILAVNYTGDAETSTCQVSYPLPPLQLNLSTYITGLENQQAILRVYDHDNVGDVIATPREVGNSQGAPLSSALRATAQFFTISIEVDTTEEHCYFENGDQEIQVEGYDFSRSLYVTFKKDNKCILSYEELTVLKMDLKFDERLHDGTLDKLILVYGQELSDGDYVAVELDHLLDGVIEIPLVYEDVRVLNTTVMLYTPEPDYELGACAYFSPDGYTEPSIFIPPDVYYVTADIFPVQRDRDYLKFGCVVKEPVKSEE